ncbi:MAG: hypothetical protein J6K66_08570 [Clostridia bacterium]|nr:hypothetical protein [Clostridia bacterium]
MTSLNDLAVNRLCRGQGQYGRTVLPLIFSIHQTADGYQHHGSFTLARFSRNRPIAYDGFITLGLWLDRSIIVPIACHRHIGSRPILAADC